MKLLKHICILLFCCMTAAGCDWLGIEKKKDREYKNVMVLYMVGRNSLSSDLSRNIDDFCRGYLPGKESDRALLLVSHLLSSGYNIPTQAAVVQLYKDKNSATVRDTLVSLKSNRMLTNPATMDSILTYVGKVFPSEHYGMIMSSHGTGWLPPGYFSSPEKYESQVSASGQKFAPRRTAFPNVVPYVEREDEDHPLTRSFGEERFYQDGTQYVMELNVQDIARAIPLHFDYIYFDACFMGGVETAYELKDCCDYIAASPAEVMAAGMDCVNAAGHLLQPEAPDVEAVCRDFIEKYEDQSSTLMRSATAVLIDCKELENLAQLCKVLFEKYRVQMSEVNADLIQGYFRSYHHWFYDLRDILAVSGATDEDLASLDAVLEKCVLYKDHTDFFMGEFPITNYCGLSMYLPCNGGEYLDRFYKTLSWNSATGLVK